MVKKQSTKKRTQVRDLPRKDKKLSAGDMKKVKGGLGDTATHEVGHLKAGDGSIKQQDGSLNIAGHEITHGISEVKK
jgi:hypothetical protein